MGKMIAAVLALTLLSACAARRPVQPAVAPSLPAAAFSQVTIQDPTKALVGEPKAAPAKEGRPCVVDLEAALDQAPEVRTIREREFDAGSSEYHLLLYRANERLLAAVRRVAARHGFALVMPRGSVALRPEAENVAVADITSEVAYEMDPSRWSPGK